MNDDRSLERAARLWLEAGPTEAPEHALERALLLIQTTAQERDLRVLRRFTTMTTPARIAAAAVIGVLAVGGASLLLGRSNRPEVGGPVSSLPTPSNSSSPSSLPSASPLDYSSLDGTILMEHLGNAPDLSEMPTTDYHPERRRLYFMDPATMTGATARQFLPDQPPSGKLSADVSPDGTQVVFMDTADPARIWIANVDGTGLRQVTTDCTCGEMDPAFDPTGTKIAFVHIEGAYRLAKNGANGNIAIDEAATTQVAWLGIRDLATGSVTKLDQTEDSSANKVPEQPTWSPDGSQIAFNRTMWGLGGLPQTPGGVLQILDVASGAVRSLSLSLPLVPGDADWSPDGQTILFTSAPVSSTASLGIESKATPSTPTAAASPILTSPTGVVGRHTCPTAESSS